jgi:tetratricopeptide (TPR) repeat protein
VYVQARAGGDSVDIEASIHVRESRTTEALRGAGLRTEIELISAGLALQILGLHGEAAELDDLVRLSPYHVAHQQYREGRNALLDWRLSEAEDHFRSAVEEDSAFALAHYQLAMTMYWRTVRDPERILIGEAIQYHVGRADRFGNEDRLRPGERRDLDAFRAFWAGDYETARNRYAAILEREPTSLDALLLAGAIEFQDPWAATDPEGELAGPRGDWDRARAMFDSAVVLTPHVQLAWGQLFEIDREVARVALKGRCLGFLPPGGPLIPPYSFPEAAETGDYCPYVEDGLIRWRPDSIPAALYARAATEAWQMRDRTVERLDTWARVERDQARPHEELADWMLWERAVRGCGADASWADSLLVEARRHTEEALAIRRDTTPEDLIRLGGLLLASGEVSRAIEYTDRALDALGDWQTGAGIVPPKSAANVYLAVGDGHPTVEILEAAEDKSTWSVPDTTVELGSISGGPVWGVVNALYALGMTGDDEPAISRRLRTLERTWAGLGYSERQQALLRYYTTSMVSAALLRQPGMWAGWFEDWDEFGLEVPPVWKGLMAAEQSPDGARDQLAVAVGELRDRPPGQLRAAHYYMPIQLAERIGEDSIAADLEALAAGCPLRLDNVDFGWGMRRYVTGE